MYPDYAQYRSRFFLPVIYVLHGGFWAFCAGIIAQSVVKSCLDGSILTLFGDGGTDPSWKWAVLNVGVWTEVIVLGALLATAVCGFWTWIYRCVRHCETLEHPKWGEGRWNIVPIVLGVISGAMLATVAVTVGGGAIGFIQECAEDTLVGPLLLLMVGPLLLVIALIGAAVVAALSMAMVPSWYGFRGLVRYMMADCAPKGSVRPEVTPSYGSGPDGP